MTEDINENENPAPISDDEFLGLVESGDQQLVAEAVESMPTTDVLRHFSLLGGEEREKLIALLPTESAACLLEEAPADLATEIVQNAEPDTAVKILEELQSNIQADIVSQLPQESADAVLADMDSHSAEEIRKLIEYDPDSAGGLMDYETFSFFASETVGSVLKGIAQGDEQFDRFRGQHPYIIDEDGKLIGVISLRNLLRSRRTTLLQEIMTAPISVGPDTSQDELAVLFDEHRFFAIPVVDESGMLIGAISRDRIAAAKLEKAAHDSMSRQRMGEELRSMPTLLRSRRRLAWLTSNIVLNIIAASVISAYEETLAAVIAIAVFLPMVSDMSGCSGNQAVAVSMRELSLGLTKPKDLFHVLKKELGVGIINGIILGILIGIVAWIWKDNAFLGLVIGLALSLNTIIAVSIGGTVPLILKRFNVDPAVASGPLLTTVTDMAGFFLVLSIATMFMGQLIQ